MQKWNAGGAKERARKSSSKGRSNLNVGRVARGDRSELVAIVPHTGASSRRKRYRALSQFAEPLNVSDLLVWILRRSEAFGNSFRPTAEEQCFSARMHLET